jgi:hypothetical protein
MSWGCVIGRDVAGAARVCEVLVVGSSAGATPFAGLIVDAR